MRYFRQALALMREERLFSGIYIAGTALAIAFTMVMAVVYYIKLAPIYPERNRARTVYFQGIDISTDNREKVVFPFGRRAFEEWFQSSPNIEYCAPTLLAAGMGKTYGECRKSVRTDEGEILDVTMNRTNADFFKIYEYDFLEGRALTPQQVENKENVCVVSDVLAERLFGRGAEAVGRLVQTTEGDMRVVGVIRSGSQLAPDSYADIILPYTIGEGNYTTPYDGPFAVVATVRDNEHLQALNQELDDVWARFQSSQPNDAPHVYFGEGVKVKMMLAKNMDTHPMHVLRMENNEDGIDKVTNWQLVKHYVGLLFVLLFVPALNLCGIVAGRMERRSAEMAVRKTFGARRTTLLNQVMMENLVLTGIGGIIGLALSWAAIYGMRTQILDMFFDNSTLSTAPIVEGEMLFAPTLFIGAFAAIMLLNLLAAVIPAWWSLRKPIVESMMEKQ